MSWLKKLFAAILILSLPTCTCSGSSGVVKALCDAAYDLTHDSVPVPGPVNPGGGPPPPDVPDNPTTPPDAEPGAGADAIDPAAVVWHHDSPATFPVTATLANVRVETHGDKAPVLSWEWTAPADWPADGNGVIGNLWIIAKIDGRWHAATWEWLRRDTFKKATEAKAGQPPFIQSKASPLNKWYPQPGEIVGHMASSPCRGGCRGVKGRSPILTTVWP